MPDKKDGKELIKIARDSISSCFSGKDIEISAALKKKLGERLGVFVTLKIDDELRGCIGYTEGIAPLYALVAEAAKAAAFSDPRFMPLSKQELDKIKIEVSVLTKPELIKAKKAEDYLKEIKIGRDGLIIRSEYGSGLLLPQVPGEWGWDVKEFLENLCNKAGMNKDAWKDLSNKIYKFSAQIFDE